MLCNLTILIYYAFICKDWKRILTESNSIFQSRERTVLMLLLFQLHASGNEELHTKHADGISSEDYNNSSLTNLLTIHLMYSHQNLNVLHNYVLPVILLNFME